MQLEDQDHVSITFVCPKPNTLPDSKDTRKMLLNEFKDFEHSTKMLLRTDYSLAFTEDSLGSTDNPGKDS